MKSTEIKQIHRTERKKRTKIIWIEIQIMITVLARNKVEMILIENNEKNTHTTIDELRNPLEMFFFSFKMIHNKSSKPNKQQKMNRVSNTDRN